MVGMDTDTWSAVDSWFAERLRPRDDALSAAVAAGASLPQIQVSELQGGLLTVLARAIGARWILEIGTLFGFSTILLARALPEDGRLVTLEASEEHAVIAGANLDRAGLGDRVDVWVGQALDALPAVAKQMDPTGSTSPSSMRTSSTTRSTGTGRCSWSDPAASSSLTTSCGRAGSSTTLSTIPMPWGRGRSSRRSDGP